MGAAANSAAPAWGDGPRTVGAGSGSAVRRPLELKNRASAASSDGRSLRLGASCGGTSGGSILALSKVLGETAASGGGSSGADQTLVANNSALAALCGHPT